jgi:hypothetical protein
MKKNHNLAVEWKITEFQNNKAYRVGLLSNTRLALPS